MKTAEATPTRYSVIRNASTGVLIYGPACPLGRLDANHWVADFRCRCSEPLTLFEVGK